MKDVYQKKIMATQAMHYEMIKVYKYLHKTRTRQEVIQATREKIVALETHKVSHHCIEDALKLTPLIFLCED